MALFAFYVEGGCAIDALDIDVRDVLGLEVLRTQKHVFVYGNFVEDRRPELGEEALPRRRARH